MGIAPRHHVVAADQAHFELTDGYHFAFRVGSVVVETATHDVNIWGECTQFVDLFLHGERGGCEGG